MAYKILRQGSSGNDVYDLQRKLNMSGYDLDVDGIFGRNTRSAVRDYQRKNRLAVDGIVGKETWGSLLAQEQDLQKEESTAKQVLSGVSDETVDRLASLEQGYRPSDEVMAADAERLSMVAMKPQNYESSYNDQIAAIYEEMKNRPDFTYDPEKDENYQHYARFYQKAGRDAMEDTMGKAAALSGGYHSSYAQAAAQRMYQQYLEKLVQLIPQMENRARDEYDRQGKSLQDRYEQIQDMEREEYDRWMDQKKSWQDATAQTQKQYEDLQKQDRRNYEQMLKYFSDKAKTEQKASDGMRVNSGKTPSAEEKKPSLSSVASASLERAMGNYLRGGDDISARALADKYELRMTPAQKKRMSELFNRFGLQL